MALLHDLSIPLRTETLENEVYTFGSRIEEPGETDDSAVLLIDLTKYSTLDDMMVAASKYFPSEEYMDITFFNADRYPDIIGGWIEDRLGKYIDIQLKLKRRVLEENFLLLSNIENAFSDAILDVIYNQLTYRKNVQGALDAYTKVKVHIFYI